MRTIDPTISLDDHDKEFLTDHRTDREDGHEDGNGRGPHATDDQELQEEPPRQVGDSGTERPRGRTSKVLGGEAKRHGIRDRADHQGQNEADRQDHDKCVERLLEICLEFRIRHRRARDRRRQDARQREQEPGDDRCPQERRANQHPERDTQGVDGGVRPAWPFDDHASPACVT